MSINEMVARVKESSLKLAALDTDRKNKALAEVAKAIMDNKDAILKANADDVQRSQGENLAAPLLKRLKLDDAKIQDMIEGIKSLIELDDPVGTVKLATELDEGLELYKVTCPIGVIGIIFESRPDALVQISMLCLKSGNGVVLKGGSEARETNRVLTDIIAGATASAAIPPDWIKLLETRADVNEMLKMDRHIDLLIPRGSNEFVRYIMDNSSIPVMGHADGICHCYVHEDAEMDMAVKVVVDSKTQYVAVCNALETLLVHVNIAKAFLPVLKEELDKKKVTLVGCEKTVSILNIPPATEDDWKTEYLDLKLSIKIVNDIDEAINHINTYGSGHTDSIITSSREKSTRFMSLVDSGNVFWNCSTRFSDGFRYGFGAEVGVSTGKLHARGPVGLDGLVSYKYKLLGNGHVVEDYANRSKSFKHRSLT